MKENNQMIENRKLFYGSNKYEAVVKSNENLLFFQGFEIE
jgi:hypothetical protein